MSASIVFYESKNMRPSWILLVSAVLLLAGCTKTINPEDATGVVFHDRNRNGIRDRGERGIGSVRVSNGKDIVLTDSNGRYRLDIQADTNIFVIKPRDWMTPVNGMNLPQFFYIHRPNGSPEGLRYPGITPTPDPPDSIDFALYHRPEPEHFDVVVFGDPQTSRREEINYLAHDAVEEVSGIKAAFGISLGDIVSDNIGDFEKVNEAIALIGLPWYNLPGNHDMNYYALTDEYSLETYNRIYGPPYYSFDYGGVHFVVLDSIVAYKGEKDRLMYHEDLDSKQLDFIRNDLALLDKHQLVVLLMHGPINRFKEVIRVELFEMLQKHPNTLSVAGHEHTTKHIFFDHDFDWHGNRPHHLYNSGAVSGAWWMGVPDETGIPHSMMTNGVPNGYSVISFNGHDYKIRFKAFRRPADYQMNIWAPEEVLAQNASGSEVLVNVFAGSERSTVEMRLDENDKWIPMQRVSRKDPYFEEMIDWENEHNIRRVDWSAAVNCSHIWRANLPENISEGAYLIRIRSKDMFGEVHTGKRLIRIKQ